MIRAKWRLAARRRRLAAALCALALASVSAAANDSTIERGKYLVRLGNCISCHTRPGGEAFAGGVPFKAPYASLGTLYSSNITPDQQSGIGRWTERQFVRALREGMAPGKKRLFPAFPYTSFTRITDEDARAIYVYLRTIAPARYAPPENSGAFALRWGMSLWNALSFESKRFEPERARSAEWNRGAYLVTALGHCGACHTPRNALLAEKESEALAGATYIEGSQGVADRAWFAINLTSAQSGLRAWSEDDLVRYLRTGHNRRAGMFGPMNEVIVNSLQYLTAEDARAMAVYIKSLPARGESELQTSESDRAGAALYAEHCARCHLDSGRGAFLKAPPLAGSAVAQGRDPATLINVILHGAQVGAGSAAPFGAWEDMKSFGGKLTDEQVAAVSTYVRRSWGNRGGAVTAREVAAQR